MSVDDNRRSQLLAFPVRLFEGPMSVTPTLRQLTAHDLLCYISVIAANFERTVFSIRIESCTIPACKEYLGSQLRSARCC